MTTFKDRVTERMTAGAVDLRKLQGGEGKYGSNGGQGCDVLEGPCSCGAWHTPGEKVRLASGEWVSRLDQCPQHPTCPELEDLKRRLARAEELRESAHGVADRLRKEKEELESCLAGLRAEVGRMEERHERELDAAVLEEREACARAVEDAAAGEPINSWERLAFETAVRAIRSRR